MDRHVLAIAIAVPLIGCANVIGIDGFVADRVDGGGGNGASSVGPTTSAGGSDPTMIAVDHPSDPYRIDRFEVTNDQYSMFLDANVPVSGQDDSCSWNDSFALGVASQEAIDALAALGITDADPPPVCLTWLDDNPGDRPVVCVDHCDARAYCSWVDKRLCGKISGGMVDVTMISERRDIDSDRSSWFRACSNAGDNTFPYGANYEPGRCVDASLAPNTLKAVGSRESCEGGVPGVFDMSGNALEWADECTIFNNHPATENCLARGGAYWMGAGSSEELQCDAGGGDGRARAVQSDGVGIRCCDD